MIIATLTYGTEEIALVPKKKALVSISGPLFVVDCDHGAF